MNELIQLMQDPVVGGLGGTAVGASIAYSAIKVHIKYILAGLKDHEERIRKIEKFIRITE